MHTREVLEKTGLKPGMCRKKQAEGEHGGRAARQRVSGRQSSVSVKSGSRAWGLQLTDAAKQPVFDSGRLTGSLASAVIACQMAH